VAAEDESVRSSRGILVAAGALGWLAAAASSAHAQAISREAPAGSDRRWAFELRFGPYSPEIDSEFSGPAESRPYRKYFGTKRRLLTQVEVDYQLFRGFGSAAVALQLGYVHASAAALTETGNEPSADSTALTLWPASLSVVYRMDLAAERWRIPLVPYVKLGLGYTVWSISDPDGNVSRPATGGRGRGGTPGWQVAGGLSFQLDILDPSASRTLDSEAGINHTYLFVEGARFDASGLWRSKALHVGDTTWLIGLMLEF
jgi:hypothetical protein